ncbi:MAG: cobalamin biosynthesis Mg chelatase CobN [Yoonia sp.]|jgi:cobalamin biosynthesis Mg chelatase CobN
MGCDLEAASTRIFSSPEGAYGPNVIQVVDSSLTGEADVPPDAGGVPVTKSMEQVTVLREDKITAYCAGRIVYAS